MYTPHTQQTSHDSVFCTGESFFLPIQKVYLMVAIIVIDVSSGCHIGNARIFTLSITDGLRTNLVHKLSFFKLQYKEINEKESVILVEMIEFNKNYVK